QVDLVDARSDQYALALLAYEMLTGVQPFSRPSVPETLVHVLHSEPPPASSLSPIIPAEVDAVLARGLSKDPADRFSSVRQLADELLDAAQVDGRPSRPAGHPSTVGHTAASVAVRLELARVAFEAGSVTGATRQAEAAFELSAL